MTVIPAVYSVQCMSVNINEFTASVCFTVVNSVQCSVCECVIYMILQITDSSY